MSTSTQSKSSLDFIAFRVLVVMLIAAALPITPFHSGPIHEAAKGSYLAHTWG